MAFFSYDDRDFARECLRSAGRSDLCECVPFGGADISAREADFWVDTLARFRRGETQDAVTAVERCARDGEFDDEDCYQFRFAPGGVAA